MKCPVCTSVNLVMSERQGVEIDYCPDCRGVWLDRGELDKIIERSSQQEPVAAQPLRETVPQGHHQQGKQYVPDHGHHHSHYGHGHKPYRKKSFLEEIFD